MKKHAPAWHYARLSGTRKPTGSPRSDPPQVLRRKHGSAQNLEADSHYYGERMCGVVWERDRMGSQDRGISEKEKEVRSRLR